MKLFVYGTLKKSGANYRFLKESKYVSQYCLNNHVLLDLGYGFPYMMRGEGSVLGDGYEIDQKTLDRIDRLEGHPIHYKRHLTNYYTEVAEMYYYLANFDMIPLKAEIVKDGYWPIDKKNKFNVIIDDREYSDTADKLVFHMRFFDGDRTPTNSDYMKIVKGRSKLDLNTENEEIFIRQCITKGVIKEIKP